MPQVSLSEAAKMVGITRSTLYTHIKDKGISVIDGDTKRPKIDVSELIRVYGDKVRPLNDAPVTKAPKADAAHQDIITEVTVLREKLKTVDLERDRERRQLSEQIENLQEQVKRQQEIVGKVTALLTDQRSADKHREQEAEQAQRVADLEKKVGSLLATKDNAADEMATKTWWPFGRKKRM